MVQTLLFCFLHYCSHIHMHKYLEIKLDLMLDCYTHTHSATRTHTDCRRVKDTFCWTSTGCMLQIMWRADILPSTCRWGGQDTEGCERSWNTLKYPLCSEQKMNKFHTPQSTVWCFFRFCSLLSRRKLHAVCLSQSVVQQALFFHFLFTAVQL